LGHLEGAQHYIFSDRSHLTRTGFRADSSHSGSQSRKGYRLYAIRNLLTHMLTNRKGPVVHQQECCASS